MTYCKEIVFFTVEKKNLFEAEGEFWHLKSWGEKPCAQTAYYMYMQIPCPPKTLPSTLVTHNKGFGHSLATVFEGLRA